jgi:hypothetical protein
MSKNLSPRTENSAKTVRGNPDKTLPHRWQPGQSGNPGGRPKRRLIDELLEELLLTEDSKVAEAIARALLAKAKRGDLRAVQLVVERVQGRPKQAMELSGSGLDGLVEAIRAARQRVGIKES